MSAQLTSRLRGYVQVTKPGIIMGNLISVAGGFLLAAQGNVDVTLMLATMLGLSLVVASGCAINNCIDRDIDAKMQRTCKRVTVTGELSISSVLMFGLGLGAIGFAMLAIFTNSLAVLFAAIGYGVYVGVYSLYMKRNSVYGTLVGSISGAVPPLVGYLGVTNYLSLEAVLLFIMFCLWQMPHSYAIAMFRIQDYRDAGIPVLPVKEGVDKAHQHMKAYVVAFGAVALGLFLLGEAGYEYLAVSAAVCFMWTKVTFRKVDCLNYIQWSKTVFKVSLLVVMSISGVLGLELIPLHFL